MKIRITEPIYLFVLLNMLYACGFQLAGSGNFSSSLDKSSVQSAASSQDLARLVEKNLKTNQIDIVAVEQATALINILHEKTEKVVLTLDSDGKALEYELILQVSFDVKNPDNSYLLREQSISLNRDFLFDKRDLLGSNEEAQRLFDEMRSDVAKLIVYRLQTITDR